MSIATTQSEMLSVLLVEDDDAFAELIRLSLSKQANELTLFVVSSIGEAKRYLSLTSPDIVISDYMLLDGNGTDLLVKNPSDLPFPVIILTSHGDEQTAVDAIKSGALDYVVKSETILHDMPHIIRRTMREWSHIIERKHAEQELQLHRDKLEELVNDRTAELAAANRELESFSYSVSHDLRSPLRHIDGYSHMLLEDYSEALDSNGKKLLKKLRKSSQRMAQLIDDLLKLSRVSRHELQWQDVDLTCEAKRIAKKMQKIEPHRNVKFIIQDGLNSRGDQALLHILLQNLLDNAWKYTTNNSESTIQVGKTDYGNSLTFFVKDNGAGFDMQYVNKIFTPFQRLHREDEFPGTGIGLASVHQIIQRHNGKIWAEGKEGAGATIYFSIG